MPLINWKTKNKQLKLKHCEIVTKLCPIILKEDGSNFAEQKDAVAKCCTNTRMILILSCSPGGTGTLCETRDLFSEKKAFFEVCRKITLAQMQ